MNDLTIISAFLLGAIAATSLIATAVVLGVALRIEAVDDER